MRAFLLTAALMVSAFFAPATYAASAGSDDAGLYTPATFTNGSNLGTGFGPWQFAVGESSLVGLTNATAGGGDINSTNDLAFVFYGGTNTSYGEATRDFNAPLIEGDSFSVTLSYDWDNGNRGLDVYNASGAQLLNINYGSGSTLNLTFSGSPAVNLTTDYIENTIIEVVVAQGAGNQLDVTVTRVNDGYTTNLVSTGLSSPAARVKFYNGGHAGDNLNYALFVNDLALTESTIPTLALSGPDGMAVGMTNDLTVTRGGVLNTQSVVSISSSDTNAAVTPASVTLTDGDAVTNFTIEGVGLGMTTVGITADGYPASSLDVMVYDLGYDDSSYAGASAAFTNGGNSGLGFGSWILINNDDGVTNFAGAFIGDSTAGGSDVNASSGDAFGLYANGSAGPLSQAIRPFGGDLAVGEVVTFEIGVNFRNGSKGAVLQNSGTAVFEIGVSGDDYWYINHNDTNGLVSLGWTNYAANTVIEVEAARVAPELYDIVLTRSGGVSETADLGTVQLGATAPNEVRFYVFSTDGSDAANNLYFNRLARYSGSELTVLSLSGNDGMVTGSTSIFSLARSGAAGSELTVTVGSSDPAVLAVTNEVVFGIGVTGVTFEVVALSNGVADITADSSGVIGDLFEVDVYDIAYDDTTYYPPATFDTNGNGGVGFELWQITDNAGPGDGFTNFAGVFLGASPFSGEINSSAGTAFGLFANQENDGIANGSPLVEATRPFSAELGEGESVSFEMALNFRNGAKGAMFQNGGTWLLEVAVFGDEYYYNVRDGGADSPVALGWAYAADTDIEVTLSRSGPNSYNARFVRLGSSPETLLVEGISLSQAPDRMRFYVFNTDNGDANNLYVNYLAIRSGIVGGTFTDGIPDAWWNQYGVAASNRLAGLDIEPDGKTSWEEYIADTDPTDAGSVLDDAIVSLTGQDVFTMTIGPTTNSRVYDVWWNDDLLADPQVWTRYGLNVAGDGAVLDLTVTNDAPARSYRTGVALP